MEQKFKEFDVVYSYVGLSKPVGKGMDPNVLVGRTMVNSARYRINDPNIDWLVFVNKKLQKHCEVFGYEKISDVKIESVTLFYEEQ